MTASAALKDASPRHGLPARAGARRLDIQGMRALAVLMVVAFHAGLPMPGGFVGVDVFFVISGFVITAMLMREWVGEGRLRLGRFYVRRFKRLTPALAVTLSVTMLLGFFVLSPLGPQQDTSRTALGAVLLGANVVIARLTGDYFDVAADSNALLNTWSLSVEEQFYLIFPLLLGLTWTLARTRRARTVASLAVVSGLGVASFVAALAGSSGYQLASQPWLLGFYSPVTRVWEFGVGALLALLGPRLAVESKRLAAVLGGWGAALLLVSLFAITGSTPFPGPVTLVPVAGTAALLVAGSARDGVTARVLSFSPLVRLGDWSYSIYLWHWPLIVFAGALWPHHERAALVAAVVSFVPAIASYRWVETPLRTRPTPTRRAFTRFVAAVLVPPIVLSVGLWQASDKGFLLPRVQDFQEAASARPEGCHRFAPLRGDTADECTWNIDADGAPIYLFGDSNAGQFVDSVVGAGRTLGRPVITSTANSCPMVDLPLDNRTQPRGWDEKCMGYVRGTLTYLLEEASPGTVIIANIDTYWDNRIWSTGPTTESMSTETSEKLESLTQGLTTMVESLRGAGHEVVLVQTIPRWTGEDKWNAATCTTARILMNGCDQSMSVSSAMARQGATRAALTAAAKASGARVFDPWLILCPDGECTIQGPGYLRYYRDGIHLSLRQGQELAPDFTEFLSGPA